MACWNGLVWKFPRPCAIYEDIGVFYTYVLLKRVMRALSTNGSVNRARCFRLSVLFEDAIAFFRGSAWISCATWNCLAPRKPKQMWSGRLYDGTKISISHHTIIHSTHPRNAYQKDVVDSLGPHNNVSVVVNMSNNSLFSTDEGRMSLIFSFGASS